MLIGRVFAERYRVESLRYESAYGRAYKAWETASGSLVELHVLWPEIGGAPNAYDRFLTLLNARSHVRGPGLRLIEDYGIAEDQSLYFTHELVDAPTLAQLVEDGGRLPAARMAQIGEQIALALATLHDENLAHGGLSTGSVMVAPGQKQDKISLCFGGLSDMLARASLADIRIAALDRDLLGLLQRDGARGARTTGGAVATDIHALGALLFHGATGSSLYDALALATPTPAGRDRAIETALESVEDALAEVIRAATDERRGGRFQSARALAGALHGAATESSIATAATRVGDAVWGEGTVEKATLPTGTDVESATGLRGMRNFATTRPAPGPLSVLASDMDSLPSSHSQHDAVLPPAARRGAQGFSIPSLNSGRRSPKTEPTESIAPRTDAKSMPAGDAPSFAPVANGEPRRRRETVSGMKALVTTQAPTATAESATPKGDGHIGSPTSAAPTVAIARPDATDGTGRFPPSMKPASPSPAAVAPTAKPDASFAQTAQSATGRGPSAGVATFDPADAHDDIAAGGDQQSSEQALSKPVFSTWEADSAEGDFRDDVQIEQRPERTPDPALTSASSATGAGAVGDFFETGAQIRVAEADDPSVPNINRKALGLAEEPKNSVPWPLLAIAAVAVVAVGVVTAWQAGFLGSQRDTRLKQPTMVASADSPASGATLPHGAPTTQEQDDTDNAPSPAHVTANPTGDVDTARGQQAAESQKTETPEQETPEQETPEQETPQTDSPKPSTPKPEATRKLPRKRSRRVIVNSAGRSGRGVPGLLDDTVEASGRVVVSPAVAQPRSGAVVTAVPDDMVVIPAGTWPIGCRATLDGCRPDAMPPRHVKLRSFAIQTREVTATAYAECMAEGPCSATGAHLGCSLSPDAGESGGARPANCLTWTQAQRFCAWRGWRLPTEIEWEVAARGLERRRYPWGSQRASCAYTVMRAPIAGAGCGAGGPRTVGSTRADEAWSGALDMGGNVAEWVSSPWRPYVRGPGFADAEDRVVRGGHYRHNARSLRYVYQRSHAPASSARATIGFRCAATIRRQK